METHKTVNKLVFQVFKKRNFSQFFYKLTEKPIFFENFRKLHPTNRENALKIINQIISLTLVVQKKPKNRGFCWIFGLLED